MARKMKKSIAMMLAAVMAASLLPMAVQVNVEANTEKASVSVYPAPQSIVTDSEEGMKFDGTVDIVVHGEQDVATLPKLKAMLDEAGVSYAEKTAVSTNAAIVLATACDDDSCTICNSVADSANALAEEQGYVLKSSNDVNAKGQVTIVGADEDGTYYGVMTLLQMMKQKTSDGRIAEVTVSDYPDVKFRGYVEGFYGFPWSFNDRKELFEDTTLYKMNTYIYAPKDDPYHRDSWRTLYPEEEAANMTALVAEAKANNTEFCWTIHPGADYSYSGTADYDKLIAKLEQVYSFGIRQFGIFYDDLSYSVANGTRHATVINNAYAYLQNKYGDIKPFITVLTRYTNSWGADTYSYFRPFMQNINEDTIVLWTGNSTMSAITYDYMQWPQTQSGIDRDFGVWWNYPVNDYCDGHLLMSPLHCLDNDVTNISTFFLNPMSEADASKVAIYSGADYSWNMEAFDSQASWERAIYELVPEANKEFERFADNIGFVSEGSGFVFEESVYLKEDLDAFEVAVYSGEGLAEINAKLKASFEQIVADADVLKNINDKELLEEITVHLDAYKVLGQAGVALTESYEAALAGNIEVCLAKMGEARELLAESAAFKVDVYDGGRTVQVRAYVGSHTLVPFMERTLNNIMTVLSANLAGKTDAQMRTNVENLEVKEVTAVDDGVYALEDVAAVMNQNDYVAIALPKATTINKVTAEVTPSENFKLQYSLNGIEWKDVDFDKTGDTLTTAAAVRGAYVRLLCTADNTNATILSLSADGAAKEEKVPVNPVITSDMTTYMDYTIGKAIDGNYNSYYWTSHGSSVGNYIQIDFGTQTILNSVALYSAINNKGVIDCFATTQLQVSNNGAVWTDVGEEKTLEDYVQSTNGLYKLEVDAGGVEARFLRFKATSNSESWLMLYELTWDITHDAAEKTISTNMGTYSNYKITNAMDGSMDTKYYSSQGANAGDYIQVDLGEETTLENATIFFGGSPNDEADAIDGFKSTKLQVSVDGNNWTDIGEAVPNTDYNHLGEGKYAVVFDVEGGVTARYVRFTAAASGNNWVQAYEVGFNDVSFVEGTASVGQSSYLDDGDIATAPVIYNVKNGDTLIYPMTTITDVATIGIYQDSAVICNAQVSVQKLDGTWVDVGTLGETWSSFDVQDTILAVKLTFDGAVEPVIYEIVVTEMEGTVNPEPPVTQPEVCEVFSDVTHGAWYEDSVQYVYDEGIIVGDGNVFAPNDATTRAMVAVILYRLAGSPKVTEADYVEYNKFTDLPKEHLWYSDAVAWALKEKVSTGDDINMRYNPTSAVTREQLALFLWRYAKYTGKDTSVDATYEELFGETYVDDWAKEGFAWAVANGVIKGAEATDAAGNIYFDLNPQGGATRAQFARVIHRYVGGSTE